MVLICWFYLVSRNNRRLWLSRSRTNSRVNLLLPSLANLHSCSFLQCKNMEKMQFQKHFPFSLFFIQLYFVLVVFKLFFHWNVHVIFVFLIYLNWTTVFFDYEMKKKGWKMFWTNVWVTLLPLCENYKFNALADRQSAYTSFREACGGRRIRTGSTLLFYQSLLSLRRKNDRCPLIYFHTEPFSISVLVS